MYTIDRFEVVLSLPWVNPLTHTSPENAEGMEPSRMNVNLLDHTTTKLEI